MATTKASSDMAMEEGMAEGLRILARMIATAHKQRLVQKAKCKPTEAKTERRRD